VHGVTKKIVSLSLSSQFVVKMVFSDTESKIERNPNGIINTTRASGLWL
jgi:hypothetical protein